MLATHNRGFTAQVLAGDWDLNVSPLGDHPKIKACREHWVNGIAWEQTGIIDYVMGEVHRLGSFDGCVTLEDVTTRYSQLDLIFEQTKKEGRFRTRQEIDKSSYREKSGVLVHIGRGNSPIFGNGGFHRLAIAQILEFPVIPAVIGLVHRESLNSWKPEFVREGDVGSFSFIS
jgi:hypothetical protein